MKCIVFFMAVIVLGLSLRPCKDSPAPHRQSDVHLNLTKDDHHQHTEDGDLCTPFCSCACCCSISLARPVLADEAPASSIRINHFSAYLGRLSERSLPVWQPPQLLG